MNRRCTRQIKFYTENKVLHRTCWRPPKIIGDRQFRFRFFTCFSGSLRISLCTSSELGHTCHFIEEQVGIPLFSLFTSLEGPMRGRGRHGSTARRHCRRVRPLRIDSRTCAILFSRTGTLLFGNPCSVDHGSNRRKQWRSRLQSSRMDSSPI
jgi:hypothetical protein